MIADENEELLKFLDNASFQLACLLDLDSEYSSNTSSSNKKKIPTSGDFSNQRYKCSGLNSVSKSKGSGILVGRDVTTERLANSSKTTKYSSKKSQKGGNINKRLTRATQLKQPTKKKNAKPTTSITNNQQQQSDDLIHGNLIDSSLVQQQQQQPLTGVDLDIIRIKLTPTLQDHQPHNDPCDPVEGDPHSLDVQLSLSITDDLPLDHVTSISPATHLSPIGQFHQSMNHVQLTNPDNIHNHHHHHQQQHHHHLQIHHHQHQQTQHLQQHHQHQHYYASNHQTHPRVTQLNSNEYHHIQHDEYNSHETIPNQQQQQAQVNQTATPATSTIHHLQQQQLIDSDKYNDPIHSTNLRQNNCYQRHHHHSQQHQHQQHHHHNIQYHQLDHHHNHHQWSLIGESNADEVTTSQQSNVDSSTTMHLLTNNDPLTSLDQVSHQVSPVAHQSLEHVHFNTPLFSHHSYYNGQADHLDSFQHLNDDPYNTTASTTPTETNNNSNSTTNENDPNNNGRVNLLRLQSTDHGHHQHSSQTQAQHQQHQIHLNTNTNTGNNSNNNHSDRNEQSIVNNNHDTNYHQMTHTHQQQQDQQHLSNSNSHNHYNSHHLMPIMMNGLVESGGVIIQDINLASASWASPEDLYTI